MTGFVSTSNRGDCSARTWMVLTSVLIWGLFLLLDTNNHGAVRVDAAQHPTRSRRVAALGSGDKAEYDRSVTTFDPTGRLLQVEYAQQAATLRSSSAVVALVVNNVVYVVVARSVQHQQQHQASTTAPLQGPIQTLHRITDSIWLIGSGLAGDLASVVRQLRVTAQQFALQTGDAWTAADAATALAAWHHQCTVAPGVRPFGVACLIFGPDAHNSNNNMRLFKCAPGGIREECWYGTVGRSEDAVLKALQERIAVPTMDVGASRSEVDAFKTVLDLMECVGSGLGYPKHRSMDIVDNDDEESSPQKGINAEAPNFDVWMIRGTAEGREDSTGIQRPCDGSSSDVTTSCFTNVSRNKDSLAKMRAHFQ